MKGPAEAAKLIDNYVSFNMRPYPVRTVLKRIIDGQKWEEGEAVDELAERWLQDFVRRLELRAANDESHSQISPFEFNSANETFLQGSCFEEPRNTPAEKAAKRLRLNNVHYQEVFKSISDLQFEKLCARILGLWKVEREYHTRASADQGIDFFGRMPLGELIHPLAIRPGAEKQMKVWCVGQAKNYNASQVSTKDIRELVGSVNLARSKVYAGSKDPLARLQMRACDPVFFLFFTTGTISRDARDLLQKAGVVAMDGNQLAVFLADKGVGIDKDGVFSKEDFLSWAFPEA